VIKNFKRCVNCRKRGDVDICPLLMHYAEDCREHGDVPTQVAINRLMDLVGEGTLADVGCDSFEPYQHKNCDDILSIMGSI
jgi:hypothetical protein